MAKFVPNLTVKTTAMRQLLLEKKPKTYNTLIELVAK
jgi:hypothetical protein